MGADGEEAGAGTVDSAPAPVTLDEAAADLLQPEVDGILHSVRDEEARGRFVALRAAVAERRVGEAELPALEQVLRLGIETGRFERVHGRAADTLARGLHARTPAGRAAVAQAEAVTGALRALNGARLEGFTVSADGPGGYRFRLSTDRGEVLLRIDRGGVRVDSVEVAD